MDILKETVKKSVSKLGYEISKKNDFKEFLPITNYSDAIYSRKDMFFEVETNITFTPNQFFFSKSNWHYHTKMVEEIIKNNNVQYKGSLLEKYYKVYRPKSLYDFYFITKTPENLSKKDKKTLNEKMNKCEQNSPWSDVRIKVRQGEISEKGLSRSHGVQSYGPVSNTKGQLELKRLRDTYFSIKKNGYVPNMCYGYIRGHFLKCMNDYRFLITRGIHRTAVLAAMKYEKIPVAFETSFPRVIDINDIKNLPQVRNGVFSEYLTKQIFQTYFEENGVNKAKKLGLINEV